MTMCPYWFVGEHDAVPDPEALALARDEVRTCQVCRFPWRVPSVTPYVLVADLAGARARVQQRLTALRALPVDAATLGDEDALE